jgi:putative membrane protein
MAQDDPPATTDKSTQWAEFRTDLAEDRNIMAMERTFAGWMRTAFAAIGIGLGFRALFGEWDPSWLPKLIATVFILGGGWLAITAERRACKTLERLDTHEFEAISTPNFKVMAYAIATGSVVLTVGLWILTTGA